MVNFVTKPLGRNQQEEQNRRYVAMCAVDFRPFGMIKPPAFRWYLGGFSLAYIEKEMHKTTVEGHLDSLCADVRAAMTVRLTEQYKVRPGVGLERPLDTHPVRRNQHEQQRVLHRELLLGSTGLQRNGASGVRHEGGPRKAWCSLDRAVASTGES